MKSPASPVFTARMADVYLKEEHPRDSVFLPGMDLTVYLQDATPVQPTVTTVERTLQDGTTDHYVHFRLSGNVTRPPQLHRLCIMLLIVRDLVTDALTTIS